MTATKLLWDMTWRGAFWGMLAGTLFGIAYAIVFIEVNTIINWLAHKSFELQNADLWTIVTTLILVALSGAFFGLVCGAPTGLVIGAANGLLIGVITHRYFVPMPDARTYRRMVAIVSAIFTGVTSWMGFMIAWTFYTQRVTPDVTILLLMVTLPAIIAALAAIWVSRRVEGWYTRATKKI